MDPTLKTVLLTLFTVTVSASIGYAFARIGRSRDRKTDETLRLEALAREAVKERDKKIEQLQDDVKELQSKADEQTKGAIPITAAMQAMLIAKLTNSHTPEADALLKKATDKTLTPDEATELLKAMKLREGDTEVSEAQRLAAKILPDMMRLNKLTEAVPQTQCKTVMVTIPETETVAARDGGTQEEEKGN